MTSSITSITTASSDGADTATAGKKELPEHGLPVLRRIEAKALISLGQDALNEAFHAGHELHSAIYRENARIRDHRLASKLAEIVECVQTAEHYLLMLGDVVGEPPRRTDVGSPRR
jgi:hypothetical protein